MLSAASTSSHLLPSGDQQQGVTPLCWAGSGHDAWGGLWHLGTEGVSGAKVFTVPFGDYSYVQTDRCGAHGYHQQLDKLNSSNSTKGTQLPPWGSSPHCCREPSCEPAGRFLEEGLLEGAVMLAPQTAPEFMETLHSQPERGAQFSHHVFFSDSSLSKYLGRYLHVLFIEEHFYLQ